MYPFNNIHMNPKKKRNRFVKSLLLTNTSSIVVTVGLILLCPLYILKDKL